jgi:hypothetical protein
MNDIQWDSSKADGQYKKTASNEKLMKYLPEFQFTPFDQALQESVDWFVQVCRNLSFSLSLRRPLRGDCRYELGLTFECMTELRLS